MCGSPCLQHYFFQKCRKHWPLDHLFDCQQLKIAWTSLHNNRGSSLVFDKNVLVCYTTTFLVRWPSCTPLIREHFLVHACNNFTYDLIIPETYVPINKYRKNAPLHLFAHYFECCAQVLQYLYDDSRWFLEECWVQSVDFCITCLKASWVIIVKLRDRTDMTLQSL